MVLSSASSTHVGLATMRVCGYEHWLRSTRRNSRIWALAQLIVFLV